MPNLLIWTDGLLRTEVNYIGHLYFPNILHEDVNYDVVSFVAERTPPMPVVYDNLGIPTEQHGLDLNSIVPDRRKGGEPQCALSTLLQILLISSPRKCLLGYELLAMLKGHFRYFRSLGTTKDWQVCIPCSGEDGSADMCTIVFCVPYTSQAELLPGCPCPCTGTVTRRASLVHQLLYG